MQDNYLVTYLGDTPGSPGSTSSSFSSTEADAEYTDNNIWPLDPVLELLRSEINRIEYERSGRFDIYQGVDWRYSTSFRDELWENFRLWGNLSQEEIADMHNCGFKRYDQMLDARWQLKNMVTLLDLLKSTAQEILDPVEIALKRASHKFGRFLNRLPLDLLAETIRFACSGSDVYELLNMSHVNRRFRGVVFSMGDMWAQVSSRMPTKILQLSLERSKNASLDLEGYFDEGFGSGDSMRQRTETRVQSFITEIAHCSSRWKNIRFTMPNSIRWEAETESYALYSLLSTTLPRDLHAPRLESLSITHYKCAPDILINEANNRTQTREAVHFYRSWNAPNLRSLKFYRIVPTPIRGASIESLSLDLRPTIRIDEYEMDYLILLQDLGEFLHETPTLQTFRLSCPTYGFTNLDGGRTLPATTLDNLRELTLVLTHQWAPLNMNEISLTLLTNCIRVPNLTTLRIKLKTTGPTNEVGFDMRKFIEKFIPQHGFTSLENLHIFIFDFTPSSIPTLVVALDRYPSLQSLTLGITGKLAVTPGSTLHPNVTRRDSLKQVKLLACMLGVDEFLTWLAGEIGEERVKGVKAVVKKCRCTKKSDILRVFPSDQLEFEDLGPNDHEWLSEIRSVGYEYFRYDREE
ncbi:hypothetical protein SCHPADRAFT_744747 [Schizopora paradoxa]|uniref:F-box domain-containing protein n=1 Tax=Schizopora paradoxa TaxID=27342 RepID=A0A0H2R5Q5_9AGAM|nr:hypothetical protein SCHPADRAFT_744747 [Schizopora paradoxa]